jgi:hypothetical protein
MRGDGEKTAKWNKSNANNEASTKETMVGRRFAFPGITRATLTVLPGLPFKSVLAGGAKGGIYED